MSEKKVPVFDIQSQGLDAEMLPFLINRLTNRLNQLWLEELRPHGLTIARWQLLSVLTVMDGQRIGLLAQTAGVEQAVFSRVVDQMERDGLLKRRPDAADSRVRALWLSSKGRRLYNTLLPVAKEHVIKMQGSLSDDRACKLAKTLVGMLANLE